MLKFTRANTLKKMLPSKPGVYTFYDNNHKLLYVGHARNLRHRVQSYRQDDDFRAHPTKAPLRPRIAYYAYQAMPLQQARYIEKQIKKRTAYNRK